MKTKDWSEMGKKEKISYHNAAKALYGHSQSEAIDFNASAKPKVKRNRQYPERGIQMKLVAWLRSQDLFFTKITNEGKKSIIAGQLDKAMGINAGVSDLFLAEPRNAYSGYWIELKAPGRKPTELQYEWLDKARGRGYKADWFDNFDTAKESIYNYLHQIDILIS